MGPMAKMFYVQDRRQVVGNCVLWWAEGRAGYTCELDRAHRFTEDEVMSRNWRKTDIPWPCDLIDGLAIRHCRAEPLHDHTPPAVRHERGD